MANFRVTYLKDAKVKTRTFKAESASQLERMLVSYDIRKIVSLDKKMNTENQIPQEMIEQLLGMIHAISKADRCFIILENNQEEDGRALSSGGNFKAEELKGALAQIFDKL